MGKSSIKERLRQNAAAGKGQPTRSVTMFLGADLDLVERYQVVTDLLTQEEAPKSRRGARLGEASDRGALEAELEQLREDLAAHEVTFRLRALDDGRWDRLVAKHPPRKGDDGQIDGRDRSAPWNSATFPIALLRATVIDPDLDDEDWQLLLGTEEIDGQLSSGQLEQLVTASVALSRGVIDIPFWSAASKSTMSS